MAFLRTIAACLFASLLTSAAPAAQMIYWVDGAGIHRANTDGTNQQQIMAPNAAIGAITVDPDHQKLYWIESGFGAPDFIRRANLGGSQHETFLSNIQTAQGITYRRADQMIYWGGTPGGPVRRTSLDGATTELAFVSPNVDLNRFFTDEAGGKLYQLDLDNEDIERVNFDGTNHELIVGSDPVEAESMAFDLAAGKVYYTDESEVRRANLDGSNRELLFTTPFEMYKPGLAVDIPDGHIYVVSFAAPAIYRMNLDGSNIQPIITGTGSIGDILLVEVVPEPSTLPLALIATLPLACLTYRCRRHSLSR